MRAYDRGMAQVLLIDGTAYLYRAYFAYPERSAPDGTPVHALSGFGRLMARLLRQVGPTHACVAFDLPQPTFRHELYPPYKSDRRATPDDFKVQAQLAPDVCRALGMAVESIGGFEADDVLATLASRAERAGWSVVVVSADKDLAQLVTDRITLWECVKNEHTRAPDVERRYGVRPDQVADMLALAGDSTDHFPGMRGVGRQTAARLLAHAGSIDRLVREPELCHHANIRNAKAIARRFVDDVDDLRLFQRLATLRRDAPARVRSVDMRWRGGDRAFAEPLFSRLGLDDMLKAVPSWATHDTQPTSEEIP